MATRETNITILGSSRPNDRPLILPYKIDGTRPLTPTDSWNTQRVTLTVPILAFVGGEEGTPFYVEAKLHLTPIQLDILIGQLTGIRTWMGEPPRDYRADADFLVEQGIFERGSNGRYIWDRNSLSYTAEGAVDAYEDEEMPVADLHEQVDDDDLPDDDGIDSGDIEGSN